MVKPDEPAVAVFRVEIRPFTRQNVGVEVNLHCAAAVVNDVSSRPAFHRNALKGMHFLRFFDLFAALFTGTTRVIIPEIEHRLTEMLNDVRAIEMNVFH